MCGPEVDQASGLLPMSTANAQRTNRLRSREFTSVADSRSLVVTPGHAVVVMKGWRQRGTSLREDAGYDEKC